MSRPIYVLFLAVCLAVVAASCGDKAADLRGDIDRIESATEKVATDEQMRSLLTLYVQYIQRYPQDAAAPIYLYRMAEVYYRATNWAEAARHLGLLLERYPNSKIEEEALIFAGMIYEERLHDNARAEKTYKDYLAKFSNGKHKKQAELFFKSPEEKLLARIAEEEANLEKNKNDTRAAGLLAFTYRSFATQFPKHEKTPNFCMQGAKLASGLGESFLALELYDILEQQHPDFADMPNVLFFTAVEYDDRAEPHWRKQIAARKPFIGFAAQFREADAKTFLTLAEKYYKLFLTKFPTHPLAKDVKISLENLGKTDNEVVKGLIEKNKKMEGQK